MRPVRRHLPCVCLSVAFCGSRNPPRQRCELTVADLDQRGQRRNPPVGSKGLRQERGGCLRGPPRLLRQHHGAAVVRYILESSSVKSSWQEELKAMQVRLSLIRTRLAGIDGLRGLGAHKGLFATLPLQPRQVDELRQTARRLYGGVGPHQYCRSERR